MKIKLTWWIAEFLLGAGTLLLIIAVLFFLLHQSPKLKNSPKQDRIFRIERV